MNFLKDFVPYGDAAFKIATFLLTMNDPASKSDIQKI